MPIKNKKKIKSTDTNIVTTLEQVAKVFEVSTRTVQFWKRDGMPVMPDGRYNLDDIRKWRIARGDHKCSPEALTKDALSAELQKIKIKREEMRFQKEMGELIAKSEVEGVLVHLLLAFKRSLLSLGRNISPQLTGLEPREIEAIINAKMRQILQDFSEGKKLFKVI